MLRLTPSLKRNLILSQRTNFRCFHSQENHSNKIYALPFKLPKEKVGQIVNMVSYVNQHAFFALFKIIKSIFTKQLPQAQDSIRSLQVRKAYIPIWYYDIAISADITPTSANNESKEELEKALGPQRQVLGIGFDCYWPGHTWDPVSYLSFPKPGKEKKFVPFEKKIYEDKEDIEIIPFSVNPLKDIGDRAPSVLEGMSVQVSSNRSFEMNNANVLIQAAYPVYWPVYIAQFKMQEKEEEKTVVVSADDENSPFYQWESTRTKSEQWINGGPWIKLDVTEIGWRVGFRQPLEQLVKKFLDQAVGHFQITQDINWEDKRIQNITAYEEQNKKYIQQLFTVWSKKNMLVLTDNVDGSKKAIGFGDKEHPGIKMTNVEQVRNNIISKISDELVKLEESEPAWYKDYRNNLK